MHTVDEITSIGIVGGGLIGLSWATLFSAFNYKVVVFDPRPEAEKELKAFVESAWGQMRELGFTQSDQPKIPTFTTRLENLKDVGFVQENGPDRLQIKHETISELENIIGEDVLIATSTSSLIASDIQSEAQFPERILVGHPMNPPHLVPMVELSAGKKTSTTAMTLAEELYRKVQRVPVIVKKEVVGHIANRLTSALYREAVYMVANGIADVEDIDLATTYGPGLRWALIGPHLTYHMGGGAGGYRHYLDHLGPTQEERWKSHGTAALTDDLKDTLIDGLEVELTKQDQETLTHRRDAAIVEILKLKNQYGF